MKSPEISFHVYGDLIFCQEGVQESFQHMVLGQPDKYTQQEVGPLALSIYKHPLKMNQKLNVSAKPVKLLDKNMGTNLHDLGLAMRS